MSRRISRALRRRVAETARFRCGYCLAQQVIVYPAHAHVSPATAR